VISSDPWPKSARLAASVEWIGQDGMLAQPGIELLEPQGSRFIQTNEKTEGLHIIELQPISIDSQERCHCCNRDAFVAVHKWMVLRQAFPKRGGFLNEVSVLAALRSCQGGFQGATISDAKGPAKSGDQLAVNGDDLSHRGVEGHCAKR
jgi:hypothetical protein